MMGLDGIAAMLKIGRKAKYLSQRTLGAKSRLPQSHISKIEGGRPSTVDADRTCTTP